MEGEFGVDELDLPARTPDLNLNYSGDRELGLLPQHLRSLNNTLLVKSL